jgi:predicted amidohydrolase YtcJ
MHAIMYNTMAFKKIGLWDPKEASELRFRDGGKLVGVDVARDGDGFPTGMTTESGALVPLDIFTREELREAVRSQVIPHYTAKGITSLMNMPSNLFDLPIDHALQAEGLLPMRLRTYYNVPLYFSLNAIIQSGLTPGVGNDMWRFGGIKHPVAGAGFDAHMRPVSDMKFTQEELDDYIWRSHQAGFQTCLHQAGESLPISLNAVERAQARQFKDLRHRLEHYSRLDDLEEIRRVKRLGMRVTITAPMSKSAGVVAARRFPRYATLIREGLEPVLISDSTGTIPQFSPLLGLASVVTPQADGGWSPEGEAPTLEQALAMWTLWAARAQHEEAHKGSIEVGKLGDFAVLSGDLQNTGGGKLFDLRVDATILGGRVVYQA